MYLCIYLGETPAPQAQHPLLLVVLVQRVLQQLVCLSLVVQVLPTLLIQSLPAYIHMFIDRHKKKEKKKQGEKEQATHKDDESRQRKTPNEHAR